MGVNQTGCFIVMEIQVILYKLNWVCSVNGILAMRGDLGKAMSTTTTSLYLCIVNSKENIKQSPISLSYWEQNNTYAVHVIHMFCFSPIIIMSQRRKRVNNEVICVDFPRCFATREIYTNMTLSSPHKQFSTLIFSIHFIISIAEKDMIL